MNMLKAIVAQIRDDTLEVLRAPARLYRGSRYQLRQYRKGKIGLGTLVAPLFATAGALAMVSLLLLPMYWILITALSGGEGSLVSAGGFQLLPDGFNPFLIFQGDWWMGMDLSAFVWVIGDVVIPSLRISLGPLGMDIVTSELVLFEAANYGVENPSNFTLYAWNSFTVAVPTVLLGMAVVVPAAYAFSRREFIMQKKILYGYILFTQVGGGLGIAVLIALYALFVEFGLTNDKLALAAYYAALAVPFNTWLLKTFMDSIPASYEEAAIIDGAPPWRIAYEIILPLSKAGMAAIFIFVFLAGWTEFIVAQTVLQPENYTLPVGLFAIVGEYSTPWARFSAFALTFAAPIMFIYLFAQRYIEQGLSFGGMEG
ncbi:ABC transporter permease subunit [Natronocalculus amylovorans]|uniref:ABC transporter permease subunit n=1 Tax=Natronocalculus amylovorans TaxID=2917812 RepID=A0AAE3K6V3_9EURY|nr:ABC transporter permease subunit [Natronocalculus amylovorans]MCL9815607.1 ABC transporter permease subunit [Natronocalculus amylovorans]